MNRCPRAVDTSAVNRRRENDRFRKKNDPVNAMYDATWEKCAVLHKNRNPICQRVLRDGRQCTNAVWLVHHLQSPRQRPDLFLVFTNFVSLCEHCHPTSEGTPDWQPGTDFVPSVIESPTCI
jgi:hypothetical protein